MAKKLYRSRTERMIAGVCGGLAEYFDIDPTLVRLIEIALTLAGGSGVLAYIIFWFVVPQKPLSLMETSPGIQSDQVNKEADDSTSDESNTGIILAGVILLVLGFIFLVGNFISFAWLSFHRLWPLALIAIGVFIILKGSGSKSHES